MASLGHNELIDHSLVQNGYRYANHDQFFMKIYPEFSNNFNIILQYAIDNNESTLV